MPVHEPATLEDTQPLGITQSYSRSLEQTSDFRHEIRIQLWCDSLVQAPVIPSVLYGLNETRPDIEKGDEQGMLYTTALTPEQVSSYVPSVQSILLQGGECVMFTCEGLGADVQEFTLTVYDTCTPMLNLTRHKGQDIERYYPAGDARAGDRPINLHCEFLIPIHR